MSRARKIVPAEVAQRLVVLKLLITDLDKAMPRHAAEIRRAAMEELDELIVECRKASL